LGDVLVQRVGRWTCDREVVGSIPRLPLLRNNLRQVVHSSSPLLLTSIIRHWPMRSDALRPEGNCGPWLGLWLSHRGLTAKKPGSVLTMLDLRVWHLSYRMLSYLTRLDTYPLLSSHISPSFF